MDLTPLSHGAVIGFSIAAPVGPIGLLCLQRTLTRGRLVGFVSGLGAAAADALFAVLAAFGVTFVTDLLLGRQFWLRLVGGFFLGYLGWRIFHSRPAQPAAEARPRRTGLVQAFVSTFFLTVTSPMTILAFTALLAGIGLTAGQEGAFVLGIFVGSGAWWLLLSAAAGAFRSRINHATLVWINRLSGLAVAGFGVVVVISLAVP